MRTKIFGRAFDALPLWAGACFIVCALTGAIAVASSTVYWSAIHAVVLSVDRRHKTLTIRHEALETAPGGVRVCTVRDSRSLARLRNGEIIEARAETSHAQWMLDDIRVVGRTGSVMRPQNDGVTAAEELPSVPAG